MRLANVEASKATEFGVSRAVAGETDDPVCGDENFGWISRLIATQLATGCERIEVKKRKEQS